MVEKKWPESWQEVNLGCVVFRPGSAKEYHTGSWRALRPVWDNAKCIKCGICYIFCPEGCISADADGYFTADLDYCKGCGICAHECWPQAIKIVGEG
jgi:pyruvate ferredoxin oxidoreductase delta subunit